MMNNRIHIVQCNYLYLFPLYMNQWSFTITFNFFLFYFFNKKNWLIICFYFLFFVVAGSKL